MNSDDEEEELCEYERKRLQNIKRNHEFLRSLGECCIKVTFKMVLVKFNPAHTVVCCMHFIYLLFICFWSYFMLDTVFVRSIRVFCVKQVSMLKPVK